MKVGIFTDSGFCRAEALDTISGHIQISTVVAKILVDAGHDVTLITTKLTDTATLPDGMPKNLSVRVVEHALRIWPKHGLLLRKILKQTWQLLLLLKRESFDVLHFFGGTRSGLLLVTLKYLGIRPSALFTPFKRPKGNITELSGKAIKVAFRQIDKIIATTDYVCDGWSLLCGRDKVTTLYPGIVNDMSGTLEKVVKKSVLFWRNANYENGVDLAMESFQHLALKYPDNRFVFAVRSGDCFEKELLELEQLVPNIDVHIYPYKTGISLATLLQNALFVVHPFRTLSINPQLAILETLYAGVPVIATRVESNEELIKEGQNGLLIPPNDKNALTCAIETLLQDPKLLDMLTKLTRCVTEERWNWRAFEMGLLKIYNNYMDDGGAPSRNAPTTDRDNQKEDAELQSTIGVRSCE